jgi:Uma2 family endonuclease
MHTNRREFLTEDEYLEFDENSAVKHEYVEGRVLAMTGAVLRHSLIVGNIFNAFYNALAGGPCRAFTENTRVKIKAANCFYYPDVLVACEGMDDLDAKFIETPALIIEVMSRSTAAIDRREKFTNYTKLASLKEYALVHQKRRKVEIFRRDESNSWNTFVFQANEDVIFQCLARELKLSMDAVYGDLNKAGNLEVKEETPEYLLSDDELFELNW